MKRLSVILVVAILALLLPIPAHAAYTPPLNVPQLVNQNQGVVMATVLVNRLRVRRAPRITSSQIGTLNFGDTVVVSGRTLESFWVQVETKFGRGWVDRSFVSLNGHQVVEIPLSTVYPPFLMITAQPSVTVRVGPEERFPELTKLPANLEVDIIGYQARPRWYLIAMPNTGPVGWVRGDTVYLEGSMASVPVVNVPAIAQVSSYLVNVRSAPAEAAPAIAQIKLGQYYIVTAKTADQSWWQISGSFGTGWVRADFVQVIGLTLSTPIVTG
ncbi:MAG: SH3 domain-containing protein [Anaerolineae bacterium]|nr:SH3 domain-containing protein [Anaerolineae bacterium]